MHILNKFSSKEMKIINNFKLKKLEPQKKTEKDSLIKGPTLNFEDM